MRDDEVITFKFEGQGEVKFTVAKCRELCPVETAALEDATDKMAVASEKEEQALSLASEKVGQCLIVLKDALLH